MTGTGHGRGGGERGGGRRSPGRDRERGSDRYRAKPEPAASDPIGLTGDASFEELPAVRLDSAGSPLRPRLGLGGSIAVVALLLLVATGFGILGGRPAPGPSPTPILGGIVPSTAPATATSPPQTPRITPFSACAPPPTESPDIQLQVNGRPISGVVESFLQPSFSLAPGPASTPGQAIERIPVPVDVITEIWVVGGACALAWHIGLVGSRVVLDAYVSQDPLDPSVAAQNRFALTLAPFAGQDLDLRVDLFFSTLTARATWPVHVESFQRPVAAFDSGGNRADAVEGCDVVVTLGNGYEFPRPDACDNDLPHQIGEFFDVERGLIRFEMDGWEVSNAVLTCGHLSDTSFVAEPEPGCFVEGSADPFSGAMTFELPPDLEGRWTVAIGACVQSQDALARNRACGTWYANADIGE